MSSACQRCVKEAKRVAYLPQFILRSHLVFLRRQLEQETCLETPLAWPRCDRCDLGALPGAGSRCGGVSTRSSKEAAGAAEGVAAGVGGAAWRWEASVALMFEVGWGRRDGEVVATLQAVEWCQ